MNTCDAECSPEIFFFSMNRKNVKNHHVTQAINA